MPITTANLGFPRIGLRRELKFALERYWSGASTDAELQDAAREIRKTNWLMQAEAGIDHIPSNDFSFYDHVLDTAALVGAVPARYGVKDDMDLATYFAMARGSDLAPAMEMTKWFDTNYHYIVPEFEGGMNFRVGSSKPIREFLEAKALGLITRPVLLGPISFVLLGKSRDAQSNHAAIAEALVEVYSKVLKELAAAGAVWVQIDEPCLGLDLAEPDRELYGRVYDRLTASLGGLKLLIATYFSPLRENLELAFRLPIAGLHLDLVRAPEQLEPALVHSPSGLNLSLGIVDGRGIWRTDFRRSLEVIRSAAGRLGSERIQIAPSCSLLHVPIDLDQETHLDPELRSWLAFDRQKLAEVKFLARAAVEDSPDIRDALDENRRQRAERLHSSRVHDRTVRDRAAAIGPEMLKRQSGFAIRRAKQAQAMPLPPLPTTTIGSLPQTPQLRRARAAHNSGKLPERDYVRMLQSEIEHAIRFQEEIGLDVLVHGEFERNDMVEYFGQQLSGFAFTSHGWVQSFGSRCVKPPILFGDVSRRRCMTAAWSGYAQSLTTSPVKGMLTGPVTMLQWSFVRDDLTGAEVCYQIALAARG